MVSTECAGCNKAIKGSGVMQCSQCQDMYTVAQNKQLHYNNKPRYCFFKKEEEEADYDNIILDLKKYLGTLNFFFFKK
ncbi:unnamed protein product [Euphydryas editha]|uniref:Uncharacterized protein n=1 Tax=Euphydryas editha TaxID=104508 RepID=A0AAU9U389_EUPED|nr:unnamed protein product [Euphydryas editha]